MSGRGRELRVLTGCTPRLLAREDALAIFVPAVVELAFVFIRPFLGDLVRTVGSAARPVHEERLVGRKGFVVLQAS